MASGVLEKIGIVACSGEELPEGTVTRVAARKVLEELRPGETVTICLPLFLAGGEGDRAFAQLHPTIAIDGCEKRCAARSTELLSGKPAAAVIVTDIIAEKGLDAPVGRRRLDSAGQKAAEAVAARVAALVDEILRRAMGEAESNAKEELAREPPEVGTCSCGSGIPVQNVLIDGRRVGLAGLPVLFAQSMALGKAADEQTARALLDTVKIYNYVPPGAEASYQEALLREYAAYREKRGS